VGQERAIGDARRHRREVVEATKSQLALTLGWLSFFAHADVMFHLVEALV
jgi:hypothetical protein